MSKRVPTVFCYRGAGDVSTVSLVGSWDEWKEQMAMKRDEADTSKWEVTMDLNPGHFTFKFVVDGSWMTLAEYPAEADGFGGENNVVDVVIPTTNEEAPDKETSETVETEEEEEEEEEEDGGNAGKTEVKDELKKEENSGCVVC